MGSDGNRMLRWDTKEVFFLGTKFSFISNKTGIKKKKRESFGVHINV